VRVGKWKEGMGDRKGQTMKARGREDREERWEGGVGGKITRRQGGRGKNGGREEG